MITEKGETKRTKSDRSEGSGNDRPRTRPLT